jgi:hypothetical protein
MYTEELKIELRNRWDELTCKCFDIQLELVSMSRKMSIKTKEQAWHGIARRLGILNECMRFFFENLPFDIQEEASQQTLTQGNINLHAFLINRSGINDNIAWCIAYHLALDDKLDLHKNRQMIGLQKRDFKKYLPEHIDKKVDELSDWFAHITSFRDPTAHRVPPYIVPSIKYDNGEINYTPCYIHSIDESPMIPLHAQLVCDIGATIELIEALITDIQPSYT